MKKKFPFFIYILIFNFYIKDFNAKEFNSNIYDLDLQELSKNKFSKTNNLTNYKHTNIIRFLADNIDQSLQIKQNKSINLEIISDIQTSENDIFTAEGNVFIKKGGIILTAEKLIYNLESKDLLVKGKITLKAKDQFLKASEISYDLQEKKGIIYDAYGTLNFKTLGEIKFDNDLKSDPILENKIDNEISNVILNQSSSIGFDGFKLKDGDKSTFKTLTSQKFKIDLNEMEKWRFKANKIEIDDEVWFSEKLFLTSDPFNKPQLVIKNIDFQTINEDGEILIKTKWSSIILDDVLKVPVGPRRIKIKEENNFRWGIGYDKDSKDGLFITRNFDPLLYGENTKLNLKKELYIQRILEGNTKSFSKKNESTTANKVQQDLKALDFIGVEADLNSKFIGLDFLSNFSLNSLDFNKFKKIITIESELSKSFNKVKKSNALKETKIGLFGTYREKVWNGSLGEKEILSSYGLKLDKRNNWIKNNIIKSSSITAVYGDYQSTARLNPTKTINRKRLNIYLERNHRYPVWLPKINNYYINKNNRFSPSVINYGLNIDAQSKLEFFRYDDGNYQNLLTLRGGPELTIGNFKNSFFDYSKLAIFPKTTIVNGNSPFGFDQSVDNHSIEMIYKQQIYGPLALQYSTEYNLDVNSRKFHEFFNTKYELSWNRRAYNIKIYYDSEQETGGLTFNIYSFNFDGIGTKF